MNKLRDQGDINITQESWFTVYRKQILIMSGFLREKAALFLGFHNSESEKGILFLFRVSSTNKDLDFKGVFIFVIRIFCGK